MECRIRNKTKNKELSKYYPLLDDVMKKTLEMTGANYNCAISLTLVGPISIRRINREYRHIDKVTDGISFTILDGEEEYLPEGEERDLGDIFININRIYSQAEEYGHSIEREFLFLFCHGLLHCLGYDHMNPEDEKEMFGLQEKILGKRI